MNYQHLAMVIALCLPLAACADSQVYQAWPVECVGRVQISLPGEADQAALSAKELNKKFQEFQIGEPMNQYPDSQRQSWVGLVFGGGTNITHPLSKKELSDLKESAAASFASAKEHFLGLKNLAGSDLEFRELPLGNQVGYGYSGNGHFEAFLKAGSSLLLWSVSVHLDEHAHIESNKLRAVYDQLVTGLRPRPLFDTPHEPGVCLPYAFIRDDGTTPHSIAMSYRLKNHPDIVINLESRSAIPTPKKGDHARPDTVTDETRTSDFWNQQMTWLHTFKTHWKRPFSTRSVDIAGRKGTASFVKVVREKGGPTDHIYLVVARGNPDAPEAEPDLRLFVEQTQENATKRGMTALTQDEVQALAEQITASVSIRPTH